MTATIPPFLVQPYTALLSQQSPWEMVLQVSDAANAVVDPNTAGPAGGSMVISATMLASDAADMSEAVTDAAVTQTSTNYSLAYTKAEIQAMRIGNHTLQVYGTDSASVVWLIALVSITIANP